MRLRSGHKLLLAILLALGTCDYYFGLLLPSSRRQNEAKMMSTRYSYGGDFYPIWLTGRALLSGRSGPYTPEATRAIQIGLYGRPMNRATDFAPDYRAFSYPLYTDVLAAPLLPLKFETVRVLLSWALVPLTAASVAFWLCALGIQVPRNTLVAFTVLTLASYPVLEGLYALQVGLIAGAATALAMAALVRNRLWLAGVLLALASVKPQIVWLLAPFLLLWASSGWSRRRGFVVGFLLTMFLLFAACWIILPAWFAGWWHALRTYSGYTLPPLPQLLLGRWLGGALSAALLAFSAVICWRCRCLTAVSAEFSLNASFLLALTVLLLPTGGAVYDQVVLLPAIFWLWARRGEIAAAGRPMRVLALAGMVALFWQWIMASGVAIASFVSPVWAGTPAVVVFPLRMAASLPFVVLALLGFFAARWLREGRREEAAGPSLGAEPNAET